MPLSEQQERDWNRWRSRYATPEAAAYALCPVYLHGLTELRDKLHACQKQRIAENVKAANPLTILKEMK